MYYTDYHTHSKLSPDSSAPLEEMAEAAVKAGLSELCVTDHYDTLDSNGQDTRPYDWAPSVAQYLRVNARYDGRLTLKLGMEFGSGYRDGSVLKTAPPELDFVIGSLHNRSVKNGGEDFYYGAYEDPSDCYAALDDYMEQMELLAPFPAYDVLGHIIYPLRYMQPVCRERVSMDRYMDRIRDVLKVTVWSGRGMELNTYRGNTIEEWRPVLQHFRDAGGEILTVGSDAHSPDAVAAGVKDAYELIRSMGFRYVAAFEHRKPKFIKL
ncbi:MAG: histidinol-phosphatase HisJ family protein [Clostridia bacterium]|nr:histidinol-phosphatase HisJ family protein [Clostridia bacterium]